jgi:pimeloyl-ACP methyl ester carboxylesterase
MRRERVGVAAAVALILAVSLNTASRAAVGAAGVTPVPCPSQQWQYNDPTFQSLPGAKAMFGRYDGGVYRIEIPATWNGELVLWAHGFVDDRGAQGSQLRVGFPGVGQGGPLRQHLIDKGYAWAASSYRCNGYIPGIGLLDTMALTDVFTKSNGGTAPRRVYLTGASMGGHVTLLGLQEFPTTFAGGLAMCSAGPGEMDFLTAVGAASTVITGINVSDETADQDLTRLAAVVGKPPAYTEKGRQLASVQIEISGGPRPFAVEGLAMRFTENVTAAARLATDTEWGRVTTNDDVRYAIGENFGLSADVINARVARKAADSEARSPRGRYEETIPFDGRIERPLMTLHGTGDLYVPIALEQTLKRAVDAAGRQQFLVQRIMRIAGHCGFSAAEQIRAFDDLTTWADRNARPDGDTVFGDLRNAGLKFTDPIRPGDPGTQKP